MYSNYPISDLASCIAHAQYIGFSDYEYETFARNPDGSMDKRNKQKATRRPYITDFEVYVMFPQVWGSTCLGHGGIGGSAMCTAYTIVLKCKREYLVYFGGRHCYTLKNPNNKFFDDVTSRKLKPKSKMDEYIG